MDYEKRYRDLIKRLKEERDGDNDYEPFCHVANEILDEFGENESEDERIRARLIEFFKGLLEGNEDCYKNGGYVSWEGLDVKSILAWLEKQKDNKFVPRVLPCSAAWFEDGEEKQKENPKSADFIPADCVSDVKCEDRWRKVSDSLPDNGRLVLAQDCLWNTLLARYDGEGNWEVSVYDNEDYYCRNTITKWCEIPSEKQKEPHYTKRNALFDKCVENCDPKVMKEVSDSVDEMLQKEQNDEDEEDNDFIIYHPLKNGKGEYECIPYSFYGSLTSFSKDKDLIDFLRTCFYTEEECNKWIEQQKEQEPVKSIFPPGLGEAHFNPISVVKQKPAEIQKESVDMNCITSPKELICSILKGVHNGYYEEEYADGFGKTAQKILELSKEELKRSAQKPAEWGENEKTIIDCAVEVVEKAGLPSLAASIKSLRPSWKPSEEQMGALKEALETYKGFEEYDAMKSLYNELKKLM